VPILAAFADTPGGTIVVFGVAVAAIVWLKRGGPGSWKRLFGRAIPRTMDRTGAALRDNPVKLKGDSTRDEDVGV